MGKLFAPNITGRGRVVRAIYGLLMIVAGLALLRVSKPAAMAAFAFAALALFEAVRGWCVVRACGIKTRL